MLEAAPDDFADFIDFMPGFVTATVPEGGLVTDFVRTALLAVR
ncbi:hypothetical protein A4R44_06865 [Amycolatopsis sp. M39]|nr:hypothetical protein A4R44_06865 [Amycolatopsis sp. M39]